MNISDTSPPIDPQRIVRSFAVSGIADSERNFAALHDSGIPALGASYSPDRPACVARHIVVSYGPTPSEAAVTVTYRY